MTSTMIDSTGRTGISQRILAVTLLAAALTYACGGADHITNLPLQVPLPTRIIRGGGQTDTVGVIMAQPLLVELHDSTGKVLAGATVNFASIDGPDSLLVSPVDPQSFGATAGGVTDAQGHLEVLVRTGTRAGTARITVAVPTLGSSDTVSFTVKAGAPAKFTISPRDTTIAPGTSFTLKVQATDRYANPIVSATPTLSATGVTVTPAGLVTGATATARARVVASYQGASDSTTVSVIPKFPMVINRDQSVVLVNSDGTSATPIATTTNFFLSNAPHSVAATSTVVYARDTGCCSSAVYVAQPNSVAHALLPGVNASDKGPHLSPDGTWVYFVRDRASIWRARLDGTGLDSLGSFAWARQFPSPTVSPDGSSIAIDDGNGIRIIDVATKAWRTVPVKCGAPSYSPDGAFFACLGPTDVSVVRTDGTGLRLVADLFNADLDDVSGVDWSPDGKWLLTTTTYQGAVLVDVASGALIPLTAVNASGTQIHEASFVR